MESVNLKKLAAGLTLAIAVAVPTLTPTTADAQTAHRQKSKNQWRNLGIAGGVLGAAGLITHNKTLAIGGLAGGAYSAYRYEQDRKGQRRQQDRHDRSRRAQRFYGRTPVRYRHDSGLHKGWSKNGHH